MYLPLPNLTRLYLTYIAPNTYGGDLTPAGGVQDRVNIFNIF
jgi:hypothetical protein